MTTSPPTAASGRLAGKSAVITGGASGMGKATVERFLAEGANVVIGDFNEAAGKVVLDELTAAGFGERVRFVRVDVADEGDVEAMVAAAVNGFGGLDVVFNNAGIGGALGPIDQISLADWNETIGVLLTGVFLGTKHGARVMKEQGRGGAIINTSSVAGLCGGAGPQAYTAAKHAVIGLTRATAVELAADRIRVNAICPGGINTPLVNQGFPDVAAELLATAQPWPEAGAPEHIAGAALFLASDDARFVTGENLVVDGGMIPAGPRLLRGDRPSPFAGQVGISRGSTGAESDFRPIDS